MSLDEFYQYLEGFNKNPGEYTKEEELEICCVYKLLVPVGEKKWSELMALLGSSSSYDALETRARRYLRTFPEYKQQLLNKFSTTHTDIVIDDIKEQTEILYKQQVKTKDLLNEYRKNLREDARLEDLKDRIITAAKSVETYVHTGFKDTYDINSDTEAILMLSDWHLGALVNNFYNKFDSHIAEYDLNKLVNDVISYCHTFGIYKLNVLNMGDLIHGGIHTNARIEQEFDVITQVEVAGQLLYKVLSALESAAPIVTYRSCSDNHSRLMANKSEHIEKENFGRLIDWWVEAKLEQGEHNIKIIRDNLDFGLGRFELLNGKKVMFAHGHEDNINQAYQNFTGATREFIDYILLAHYHNPKEKSFQDCKVIVNGSLVGTESYALSKRLFASPCQKLLVFDSGDNFIDISLNTNTRKFLKESF